jgi:hypothetical protein
VEMARRGQEDCGAPVMRGCNTVFRFLFNGTGSTKNSARKKIPNKI